MTASDLRHRYEIDALRAISIIIVCFYHFRLFKVTGGFIGVDIFFVISGFLMTNIIYNETQNGIFSFSEFATRRIIRLYPTFVFVILITYFFCWVRFNPHQFLDVSYESISALFGLSNIYFWSKSGYFDTQSIEKPLLHTWSLSLEFQFYILWSVFIFFISKFNKYCIISSILFFTIASFLLSLGILNYDKSAAFFLIPSRLWEFCIGGIIVFMPSIPMISKLTCRCIILLAVIIIAFNVYIIDSNSIFPSYGALPAVLTAAAFIYFSPHAELTYLFKNWLAITLGRISYTLYLIHWPIIVFLGNDNNFHVPHFYRLLLFLLCIILSLIVYRLIESPIRKKEKFPPSLTLRWLASFSLAASLLFTYNVYSRGIYVYRSPTDYIIRNANLYDKAQAGIYLWNRYHDLEKFDDFITDKPHLLIIGDSQSADLLNVLSEMGIDKEYEIITRKILWECGALLIPPNLRDEYLKTNPFIHAKPDYQNLCKHKMSRLESSPALSNADIIIAGFKWDRSNYSYIDISFNSIREKSKARIFTIGKKDFDASSIDILNNFGSGDGIQKIAYTLRSSDAIEFNNIMKNKKYVYYIDMYELLCDETNKSCNVITDTYSPVLWDTVHFTREAATYFSDKTAKKVFGFLLN